MGVLWQTPGASHVSVVQGLWSLQVPGDVQGLQGRMVWWEQTPETQESVVQAFWSSQSVAVVAGVQRVLAGIGVLLQAPRLHWSGGQALWAAQSAAGGPTQAPAAQISVCVHALPSVQGVPSAWAGLVQAPVAGSQVPAVWHWSEAVHTTGFVPTQAPATQASVCVHTLPSVQGVPSAWAGLVQAHVAGSQVPAVWHSAEAVHTRVIGLLWQTPGLQESVVQAFPSSQSAAVVQSLQPAMGAWLHEPKTQ